MYFLGTLIDGSKVYFLKPVKGLTGEYAVGSLVVYSSTYTEDEIGVKPGIYLTWKDLFKPEHEFESYRIKFEKCSLDTAKLLKLIKLMKAYKLLNDAEFFFDFGETPLTADEMKIDKDNNITLTNLCDPDIASKIHNCYIPSVINQIELLFN